MTYRRILFANVGWMISYNGQSSSDLIFGGGSYSDIDKHESFNFQNLNGKCYGYVQPVGDTINLNRIDPSVSNSDRIDDVTVIWFAPNKAIGGSWIVGWYRNATVYRYCQELNSRTRHNYGYYVEAKYDDCTLLPVDERTHRIPRRAKNYPGRSNVWYADAPEVNKFREGILEYIDAYLPFSKFSRTFLHKISAEARRKVEKAAIEEITQLYKRRGYKIKDVQSDNLGWDLEAVNGVHRLLLEVKGQGNHEPYIRITKNEYEQMMRRKDIYRLCVVMNALEKPEPYVFLSQCDIWVDERDDSIHLDIDEMVAAVATFQISNKK